MSALISHIHSSSRLVTAGLTVIMLLATDAINHAQSADSQAGARADYARAIEKVEALRQLQALLSDRADAQGAALGEANRLRTTIEDSARLLRRATDSIGGVSECLRTLSRAIESGTRISQQYQRAARESLAKATDFSRAGSDQAAARLADAEPAFQRRFERKQALLAQVADVTSRKSACSGRLSDTEIDVRSAGVWFDVVNGRTRALVSSIDLLESLTLQIVDLAITARSRGWLGADIATIAFPPTSALKLLRQRVDDLDGVARLELRDPHPRASKIVNDYQDAVLRFVVEEDAHRFLALLAQNAPSDCTAEECLALLDRAKQQDALARAARQTAEDKLAQVERTIQETPGLGVFARDPSAWLDAQTAIERSFEVANTEVRAIVDSANRVSSALERPVSEALEQAVNERRDAYRRVFGVPEAEERAPRPAPAPPPPPAPAPEPAGAPPPGILLRHAFEVLALRSQESPDYGAYTYVIFPRREQRPEYQALLDAIIALTSAADPDAPREVKKTTNLFEIPGRTAEPIGPADAPDYARAIGNYDFARALSLVDTASSGVLTAPKVLRQFQRSPGPFLLTVPVPLEQAKGATQLLLADLSGYPLAGFQDLVKSYQLDLIAAFPTTQALWRPPWNQRIALGLMNIGVLMPGQNFVALRR